MAAYWNVFRCPACNMCHGRKSFGHNCPHCGQKITESTPVVGRASNPTELRMKVLTANTPPELRQSLTERINASEKMIETQAKFSLAMGLTILRDSIDERGRITIARLQNEFLAMKFTKVSHIWRTYSVMVLVCQGAEGSPPSTFTATSFV